MKRRVIARWSAAELADLRERHPESCWHPSKDRREACGLPKGHSGLHGWDGRRTMWRFAQPSHTREDAT